MTDTTFAPQQAAPFVPQQPSAQPEPARTPQQEHIAQVRFPLTFADVHDPFEVERLCKAYDRFEQLVTTVRTQFPDASDVQFVGDGEMWVHENGVDRRTNVRISNAADILVWAKLFGRGGDGDDRLRNDSRGSVENAINIADVRLRMTFRRQMGGFALNIRFLAADPPTVDSVRFAKNPIPQPLVDLVLGSSAGLVLVEGPTGSGKSTMQAALIAEVNRRQQRHIYTLEDPIEFVHKANKSLITQREIGVDVSSFEQGLITAKRSKPGIILLGELRDRVVMRAAVDSAGEGHLVMATSHASDVPSAIDSFIGSFPSDEQAEVRQRLATTLKAVVVQRLVPSLDGKVIPVRELLTIDATIATQIRSAESSGAKLRSALQSSGNKHKAGTFSFDDDLVRLAVEKKIHPDVAMLYSVSPREVYEILLRRGLQPTERPTE